MLRRQPDTRRAPALVVFLILALGLGGALLLASTGCGTGPYESCLGDDDCPGPQVCLRGACLAKTTPEPTPQKEPVLEVPATEPAVPDAGREVVPERPKEAPPTPTGCRSDADCKNGQTCEAQKCVVAPVPSCFPNKHLSVFRHAPAVAVRLIASQPSGALLATHADYVLSIADTTTGRLVFSGKTPFKTAAKVFWSADGSMLAAVEQKGQVALWSVSSSRLRALTTTVTGAPEAFSPDGKFLLIAQTYKQVDYVDVQTGALSKSVTLAPANDFRFAVGSHFAPGGTRMVAFESFARAVVWDVVTGKIEADFPIDAQGSYFSSKGFLNDDLLAIEMTENKVSGTFLFSCSQGKSIATLPLGLGLLSLSPAGDRVLYIKGGELKEALLQDPSQVTATKITTTTSGSITAASYHKASDTIVVSRYSSNKASLTSYKTADYSYHSALPLGGQPNISMLFHPSLPQLMTTSGDGVAKVWQLEKDPNDVYKPLVKQLFFPQPGPFDKLRLVMSVRADWKYATTASREGVQLWDMTTNKSITQYKQPDTTGSRVHHLAFQPNGVVSLFEGRLLERWDLQTGAVTRNASVQPYANAVSLIGAHAVTGDIAIRALVDKYNEALLIWDPVTLRKKHQIVVQGFLWHATFANKKPWLVAIDRKRQAIVFDINTGQPLKTLPVAFGNGVLRFSPDDSHVAIRAGVEVEIFETTTWRKVQSISASSDTFAFSPTGEHIALVGVSGIIELYDVKTGKLLNTIASVGGLSGVNMVQYDASGTFLAFGSDRTGEVEVWRCAE